MENEGNLRSTSQMVGWAVTIFAAVCVPLAVVFVRTQTDIATISEGERISTLNQDRWDLGTSQTISNEVQAREAIAVKLGALEAAIVATNDALKRTDEMSDRRHRDRSDQFSATERKIELLEARLIDLEIVIRGATHK